MPLMRSLRIWVAPTASLQHRVQPAVCLFVCLFVCLLAGWFVLFVEIPANSSAGIRIACPASCAASRCNGSRHAHEDSGSWFHAEDAPAAAGGYRRRVQRHRRGWLWPRALAGLAARSQAFFSIFVVKREYLEYYGNTRVRNLKCTNRQIPLRFKMKDLHVVILLSISDVVILRCSLFSVFEFKSYHPK